MIGPPAAARAFTNRPGVAMALSVAIALIVVWAAIALSYQTDWPVGFFVGTVSAAAYATGRAWTYTRRHQKPDGTPSEAQPAPGSHPVPSRISS